MILSHNAVGKGRQIMKRVALCNKRKVPQPFAILPAREGKGPRKRRSYGDSKRPWVIL